MIITHKVAGKNNRITTWCSSISRLDGTGGESILICFFLIVGIDEDDGIAQLAALDGLVCEISGFHPVHHHFDHLHAQGNWTKK